MPAVVMSTLRVGWRGRGDRKGTLLLEAQDGATLTLESGAERAAQPG